MIPNRDHSNWARHGINSNNKNQTKKIPNKKDSPKPDSYTHKNLHKTKKNKTKKKKKKKPHTKPLNIFYLLSTYQTTSPYKDR